MNSIPSAPASVASTSTAVYSGSQSDASSLVNLNKHVLPSGYALPSIHSWPPFFTLQRNPTVIAEQRKHWTQLILSYAAHRRLFYLRVTDCEQNKPSDWSDIFLNPRIKRSLNQRHLQEIIQSLVSSGAAQYEPEKQTSSILLFWRKPEEWAETLYQWASSTGQMNTILTFYEIMHPELKSELEDIPLPLLRQSITILNKSSRAQAIDAADGGGARFFTR